MRMLQWSTLGFLLLALACKGEKDKSPSEKPLEARVVEMSQLEFARTSPLDSFEPVDVSNGQVLDFTVREDDAALEGLRKTSEDQAVLIKPYGPFMVSQQPCRSAKCEPHEPIAFIFNHNIAENGWDDALVKVEPNIPDMKISLHGNDLRLDGFKMRGQTYSVTFRPKSRTTLVRV